MCINKFNLSKQCKLDSTKFSIKNVITKRKERGATKENLLQYLEHLKTVWKNELEILQFINNQREALNYEN